jgi:hypothetical protein
VGEKFPDGRFINQPRATETEAADAVRSGEARNMIARDTTFSARFGRGEVAGKGIIDRLHGLRRFFCRAG